MRGPLSALAVVLVLACGVPGAATATAADAAVRSSDLPKGLQRCSGSGEMDGFLKTMATKNQQTYLQTKAEWDAAKKAGATAGEAVFYSDSAAHCSGNGRQNTSPGTPGVINYVFQFKDEATAGKAYADQSVWGLGAAGITVTSGANGTTLGTRTGLSTNSVSVSLNAAGLPIYVAFWQNRALVLMLVTFNIPTDQAKNAAVRENGRIG